MFIDKTLKEYLIKIGKDGLNFIIDQNTGAPKIFSSYDEAKDFCKEYNNDLNIILSPSNFEIDDIVFLCTDCFPNHCPKTIGLGKIVFDRGKCVEDELGNKYNLINLPTNIYIIKNMNQYLEKYKKI